MNARRRRRCRCYLLVVIFSAARHSKVNNVDNESFSHQYTHSPIQFFMALLFFVCTSSCRFTVNFLSIVFLFHLSVDSSIFTLIRAILSSISPGAVCRPKPMFVTTDKVSNVTIFGHWNHAKCIRHRFENHFRDKLLFQTYFLMIPFRCYFLVVAFPIKHLLLFLRNLCRIAILFAKIRTRLEMIDKYRG